MLSLHHCLTADTAYRVQFELIVHCTSLNQPRHYDEPHSQQVLFRISVRHDAMQFCSALAAWQFNVKRHIVGDVPKIQA